MKVITKGSKIGIHAIWPNQTMSFVRKAKELGFRFSVVKGVDNAGLAMDVKRESPETITITRFVNRWDSLQDVQLWSQETRLQFARESIQLIFDRTNEEEYNAADYFEVINEASPKGFYYEFGLALIELVKEADKRGVKLCLPAFNAGTPEWSEMVSLANTGLFKLMKDGGHILAIHEGSLSDNMKEGFGDIIPGAPRVDGAGSMSFRYKYLYHLLKERNEIVPCIITEFYAGMNYNISSSQMIDNFAWYDGGTRLDYFVLGVLPFTVDPSPGWAHQNYNPYYLAVLEYMNFIKDFPNALEVISTPVPQPVPTPTPTPTTRKLVGLHGRADGRMQPSDFEVVRIAKIEAVKLLDTADPNDVNVLKSMKPDMFILVRLFEDFRNRIISANDFVSWKIGAIRPFYDRGVRHFEIHNEPNLIQEGLGSSWMNGFGFTNWFNSVYNQLKAVYPDCKFGFPGISPGTTVPGIRMDEKTFISQSNSAIQKADWIGVHSYWVSDVELIEEINGKTYKNYTILYPSKDIYITEFSNPSNVSKAIKANQYVKYYEGIKQATQIVSAFSFVCSASHNFLDETWRYEDGSMSEIPALVGNRIIAEASLVGKEVEVNTTQLNCRSGPGAQFPILTTFYFRSSFIVKEQVGDWIRVSSNGWIHKGYTKVV
jgi:hypothetical protein